MANVRQVDSVSVAPPTEPRLVSGKTEMDSSLPMLAVVPIDVSSHASESTAARSAQPHACMHEQAQVHNPLAHPRPPPQWLRDMLHRMPPRTLKVLEGMRAYYLHTPKAPVY